MPDSESDIIESDIVIPSNPEAERFYEGAYARIVMAMIVIAGVATPAACWRFGWRVGAGVAVGCTLAGINFLWMKRAIQSFAGRLANVPEGEKATRGSATRFVLRYGLIGVAAYVIFKSSVVSLSGVLAGLFLPVAAILVEAGYETYAALRRGL